MELGLNIHMPEINPKQALHLSQKINSKWTNV